MRFIPTSDITVENLKKQAKKLQRKLGGKHTDLLNRVAKSANYEHWHHVIKCHAQTTGLGNHALIAECFKIVSKAKKGIVSAIFTGPQTSNKPFILFSTEDGDAWLLDPREKLVSNLMWQGQENQLRIDEDSSQIKIDFDGRFDIKNGFFEVWIPEPNQLAKTIGHRSIFGYPVLELQQLMGAANDLSRTILYAHTEELTTELIDELSKKGWDKDALISDSLNGGLYCKERNSIVFLEDDI